MKNSGVDIRIWFGAIILASVDGLAFAGPLSTSTQDVHEFNISSTDPTNAIHAFGKQAGIQIVASADDLRNKKFNSISETISTDKALSDLLAGTGLEYRYVSEKAVALVPDEPYDKKAAPRALVAQAATAAAPLAPTASEKAATAPEVPAAENAESSQDLQQVVVTGTRFKRNGYEAPTPLTVIGAAEIQAAAPQNIADYVNNLPQLSGSLTPTNNFKSISSGSTGLNVLNLRNLGTTRTLVLVDGQRWVTSDVDGEVDINNIPQGLVSRVDVVTGGASATYGSDAVAGVVNFILDKNFTGVKGEASGGITGYGDDPNWNISLTAGTPFADNRGHFLIEADVNENQGIMNNPRPWALTGWKDINNPNYTATNGQPRQLVLPNVGMSDAAPGGMIASGPLRGIYFGLGGTPYQFNYGPIVSDPFVQGGDWRVTDNDTYGSLDTSVYRYSIFTRASYDVTDDLNVYVQATHGYTENHGYDAKEYSLGGINVSTSNPFLPAAVANQAQALGLTSLNLGTTYGDLPPFGSRDYRTVNRFVLGANGKFNMFNKPWTWDFYATEGISDVTETVNVSINSNLADAIQAVRGPTGAIVCASTVSNPGNGCIPFDIFGTGVNSPGALNYVEGEGVLNQRFEQTAGAVNVQGEPFSIWAGPVSLALGIEARRESVNGVSTPQDLAQNEFAGNFIPVIGHYEVTEAYVETDVPLAKDAAWAKQLDINAAARATDYSVSGYVTTWKLGLTYTPPVSDIKFRATTSSDIRAPNLADLFTKGATAVFSVIDPMINNANYLNYDDQVGNPNLKPEKARTAEAGFVVQPHFLPGFSGSVDWYYIKINQAIGEPSPQQEVNFCYGGVTSYCSALVRDGPLLDGVPEISLVYQEEFNEAAQKESGIDFDLSYHTDLHSYDNITVRLLATHYMYDIVDAGIPGVAPVNYAGTNAGEGPPSWRYLSTVTYNRDPVSVTLTARGLSAGRYSNSFIECTANCPTSTANNITINDNHIAGAFYLDGNLTYTIGGKGGSETELFFNVQNLLNKNPPIVAQGPGGTTFNMPPYNPIMYDVLGREFRAGVRFKL